MTDDEFTAAYNAARTGFLLESDETNDEDTRNRAHESKQYAVNQILSNGTDIQRQELTLLMANGWKARRR